MVARKFGKPFDLMVYEGLRALEERVWEELEESVANVGHHIEKCQAGLDPKAIKGKVKMINKALAKVTKSKREHMLKMRETQRNVREAFVTMMPLDEETPEELQQQQQQLQQQEVQQE